MTNPHEKAARARKVLRVVTTLVASGMALDKLALAVTGLTDADWLGLAAQSGVNECSEQTRSEVIAAVKRLSGERRAA